MPVELKKRMLKEVISETDALLCYQSDSKMNYKYEGCKSVVHNNKLKELKTENFVPSYGIIEKRILKTNSLFENTETGSQGSIGFETCDNKNYEDDDILEALSHLQNCKDQNQAYTVLKQFKETVKGKSATNSDAVDNTNILKRNNIKKKHHGYFSSDYFTDKAQLALDHLMAELKKPNFLDKLVETDILSLEMKSMNLLHNLTFD